MDGLLVIEQTVTFDGKTIALNTCTITLVGANPTPQTEETSYAPVGPLKGYLEGFVYGAVTFDRHLPLATIKKKNIVWNDLSGLETVYNRASTNLLNYMDEELAKIKK